MAEGSKGGRGDGDSRPRHHDRAVANDPGTAQAKIMRFGLDPEHAYLDTDGAISSMSLL